MKVSLVQWPKDFQQAKQQQLQLATQVSLTDDFDEPKVVAGVDVGFVNDGKTARAAVVYCDAQSAALLNYHVACEPVNFPYVPGYLSFRELPSILKAFSLFSYSPDLILCDGQGIAHPRQFGIACHLGVLLDKPTIGVAKSRLVGTGESPPLKRGCYTLLKHQNEVVAAELCTRSQVKPVFVSPGHKVSLASAIHWTLAMTRGFKLPEPTRWADKIASDKTNKYHLQYSP